MPRFGKPGERIGYKVYPQEGASPIVLVHGFTASSTSFAANVPELNKRFEVISVDLLGHGESEAPSDAAPYAPDAAVARILALLDDLGHQKVLLCGHSLGAALCLRLALDAPQRLSGLILINSMSAAGTPEWREDARPGMVTMAARLRAEGSDFLRQTRLYPAHSKRLDPDSRALLMSAFDATAPSGLAGTAEGLVIDVNSYERLGELAVPTLVVVGDLDKPFAAAAPDFIARMPPGMVREVHLEEAGHAANIEQPRAFEAAVVAFAENLRYLQPADAAPLSAPLKTASRRGNMLTAVGSALVVGGLAMLAGAFFVARGDGDSSPIVASAANSATSTPTNLSLVAGTRSASPAPAATTSSNPQETPVPATSPTAAPEAAATALPPSPTFAATATATATATARPTSTPTGTPQATATATPIPPTSTATAVPPTPTPSGPRVAISGPGAASVGSPVSFVASAAGGTIIGQPKWFAANGSIATANPYAPVITFSQPGCQSVTVTFLFAGGVSKTAATSVPVGGAAC